MSVLAFSSNPNPEASGGNVRYITRDSACESISFHNLPELETGEHAIDKANAIAYAEEREAQEVEERGCRNHYRLTLTFDRDVPSAEAKAVAHEYLDENFPNTKAVVAVHQHDKDDADREKIRDEDHTHVHVWVDCRDKDTGKKLEFDEASFRNFDEKWSRHYDRRYGTEYSKEFGEKKLETRNWRREYREAKRERRTLPKKPERVADRYRSRQYREKDLRDTGVRKYDKKRTDRGQRSAAGGDRSTGKTSERFGESKRNFERANRALSERARGSQRGKQIVDRARREAGGISRAVKSLPERTRDKGRGPARDHNRGRERGDDRDRGGR